MMPTLKYASSGMAKIDRLGWAAGISFLSHGARIGIRVNDPDVLERLLPYLPPDWKEARSPVVDDLYSLRLGGDGARPSVRHCHLLYGGSARLARSLDLEDVFDSLESVLHRNVAVADPSICFQASPSAAFAEVALS